MAKPVQDAIKLLDGMKRVLTPDGNLTPADAKVLNAAADRLKMSRAIIEGNLNVALHEVGEQMRLLADVNRELNAMVRALNWLDSAIGWEKLSKGRRGGVVHNANAQMVMCSNDLKKSLAELRDVSERIDGLDGQLGL